MKKYIYPILCTLLIVSQGCDHFLGNKPKGYAIPEAFEDYVKLFASQSLNSCMSTDAFYLTDDVHLLINLLPPYSVLPLRRAVCWLFRLLLRKMLLFPRILPKYSG